MQRRVGRSVQSKLRIAVLLATLAALAVAITAMVAYDLVLYHKSWLADLSTQAALLGRTSAPALAFDQPKVAKENLDLLRYRPKVRAAAIYNAKGQLFASYTSETTLELPVLPEAEGEHINGNRLTVFKRIVNDGEILGTVYLLADYELYERLGGYLGIAAAVAAIGLLVAYVLSRRLQRAVTQPLFAMAETAREISEKRNYALRATKLTDDEIGVLAESFNTMLAEIERATHELEASNREAAREVAERRRVEQDILVLNAELEERVRKRTSELEYANSELEAFCYSVSHDLRAPLRSIAGFSQALAEDFPADLSEEAHRYLARIRSSVQRMAQLIEDLLNLSRVSRADMRLQDVDVSEIAGQVVKDLQARDPDREIEISIWDGMHAQADPRLLRAAFENLIGNSWKFTAKAAHPRIEVGIIRDGSRSTYYVRDNGAGFDMSYASKLFGPFQRLHSVSEFQGTGIGLATVQRIVHRHGGRIWADAKPGMGAVFFFTLEPDGKAADDKRRLEAQA